jgi:deaminated glutathione amidase
MRSGEDVSENIRVAERLLSSAAGRGADLASLPEVFTYHGRSSRQREMAEPIPGPASDRLAEAARRHGMWVLGGSILEADGDRLYNTSLLFDRAGEQVARYRKIHLFDVELSSEPSQRESKTYTPGDEIVTADTEFARVGLSICYDLRFPELYRGLVARGAEVLLVPSAFTQETGVAHWEVLLRARAIENEAFVVAPAQWGTWGGPGRERRCHGNSMVVDPWGRVLERGPEEGTDVVVADLDFAELRRVRQRLPVLQHRRLGPTC